MRQWVALLGALAAVFPAIPEATAAGTAKTAFTAPHPLVNETFADISCGTNVGDNSVGFKGSGVDYPPNLKIDVFTELTPGDALQGERQAVKGLHQTTLFGDGNGAWSAPTYYELVNPSGTWKVRVAVHEAVGGSIIGEAANTRAGLLRTIVPDYPFSQTKINTITGGFLWLGVISRILPSVRLDCGRIARK